jgi:hypothetical protein
MANYCRTVTKSLRGTTALIEVKRTKTAWITIEGATTAYKELERVTTVWMIIAGRMTAWMKMEE